MLDVLGEAALRTFLLAALVQCVLWLLRVGHSRLLLAAWTVILVASLGMPMLSQLALLRIPVDPALSEPLIGGAADLLQQPLLRPPAGGDASFEGQARPLPGYLPGAAYAVIACGLLLRVVLGLGLSLRLLARSVPLRRDWTAGYRVRISRDVTGPVTVAGVILLPDDALAWASGTRQAVLAHEHAHVTRWDFALLVGSQLNRALFWFSPLSWWLHRRLVTLTEMASDDQAMAVTGDRLAYAEVLLEMGRRPPVPRGPAMARPTTLHRRIDRILANQVNPYPAGRPRQALLTAGVAGLSLAVAGLAHGPAGRPEQPLALVMPPMPPPLQQRGTAQGASPMEAAAGPPQPAERGTEARSQPAPPPARPASPAASRPAPRPARQPPQIPVGQARPNGIADREALLVRDAATPASHRPGMTTGPGAPALHEGDPAPLAAYASSPFQSGLDGIAGNTCVGTVAVGLRAAGGVLSRPNVLPGQSVPAQAQFFRKDSGTLWVRFNAFGRPALDLPVRFARNGMTWTGEYGIAYTVRAAGGNRLAGLASLVANDSAGLDFACSRSTNHLL